VPQPAPALLHAVDATIAALRRGSVALLLRGQFLYGRGRVAAERIAAATGARLMADTFMPRKERGAGHFAVERLPCRAAQALQSLGGVETLVLVGAQAPVGFSPVPASPANSRRKAAIS
jgi:acetolactate synthase-1/2/3 large subunit